MGLFTALGIGAGILGGSIISGIFGKKSAEKQAQAYTGAATTQAGATDVAAATQERMFERALLETEPWRRAGVGGLNMLMQGLGQGPGPFDYEQTPYFRTQMEQVPNILKLASSQGMLGSGATQKALADYFRRGMGEDYWRALASHKASYYEPREELFRLAGLGGQSAAQTATMAQQTGGQLAQTQMQQGNILAQGQLGAGMAGASSYAHMGNILNQGMSNMMMLGLYGADRGWWS